MAATLTYSGTLTVNTCWCGIRHAVPTELEEFQQRQHHDGENPISIFCPLGHQYVPSGRPRVAIERDRTAEAELRAERAEARAQAIADQLAAEQRAAKRAEKRAAAALCPIEGCGRQFVNLGRHMHSKHPEHVHPATPGKREKKGPTDGA